MPFGVATAGTRTMDFESVRQMLQSNYMEEVQYPQSNDIFNVFCKKDGEYIGTIQVIDDETQMDQKIIAPLALRLLEQEIGLHRFDHQADYPVSIYEEVVEPAIKQ